MGAFFAASLLPPGEGPSGDLTIPDMETETGPEACQSLEELAAMQEAASGLGRPIMGGQSLRKASWLQEKYGPGNWVKMQWVHHGPGRSQINVHWYRNETTRLSVMFKVKYKRGMNYPEKS